MIKDYFKLAISNLRKRKLRSWLTLVGIFISIATIFTLISLSYGLQGAVTEQIRSTGADKLFITAKGGFGAPGSGTATTLTKADADYIKKISGVKRVTYFITGNAKVEYNNQVRFYGVYGIPDKGLDLYFESNSMSIDEGRSLKSDSSKEVLVGYDFKYGKLFDKPLKAGSKIILNGEEFKVQGILSKIGNSQDDRIILMGEQDFKELFNSGERVDYIYVQVDDETQIRDVASTIERKLRSFRDVTEKTQDFTILTPEELLKTLGSVLNIITAFLAGIAAISLLVGGIGIANTMYTSVLERTREIGVMKAVGAKNKDILLIFVIESGLIGLVGGIIGVGLGISVAKLVEYIATNQLGTNLLQAATPFWLIMSCIDFAFLIGILSGLLPARHASSIKTVDALRYE